MKRFIQYTFLQAFLVAGLASPAFAQTSVGDSLINVVYAFSNVDTLFYTFCWIAGGFLAVWSIFTFRDHVDGGGGAPPLSLAVKRMLMGAMFLAFPAMAQAAIETWIGYGSDAQGFYVGPGGCEAGAGTLDAMAVCFISDIAEPMSLVLSAFAYIGGIMLILLAISRLTKSYQEGARGPTGIGTIMTLLAGGALLSSGQMMAAFSTSIFGDATAMHNPIFSESLQSAVGDNADIVKNTISALLAFIAIVGWIAFIRGWFVLRAVADGNQQVSIAQALTFLFGGALAVNLGDLVNAVSQSVGGGLGITFG